MNRRQVLLTLPLALAAGPARAAGVSYGYLYYGANLQDRAVTDWQTLGDTRDGTSALRYLENGATMNSPEPAGLLPPT